MSGLKPGPISDAKAKATANAKANANANAKANAKANAQANANATAKAAAKEEADSFAALRNDSQKGKCNNKSQSQYSGPSLRSRMTGFPADFES